MNLRLIYKTVDDGFTHSMMVMVVLPPLLTPKNKIKPQTWLLSHTTSLQMPDTCPVSAVMSSMPNIHGWVGADLGYLQAARTETLTGQEH